MAEKDPGNRKQSTGVDWVWDEQAQRYVPSDPEVRDLYSRGGWEQMAKGGVNPLSTREGLGEQYPDTWKTIMDRLQSGGDASGLWTDILTKFRGGQDLTDFMRYAAPFMAATLYNSPAYKAIQDFEPPTMESYGVGSAQIQAGAEEAQRQGGRQLASAGLGRSGAMAGLARRAQQDAAQDRSGLYAGLKQQHYQNRQQGAQRALDAQRQIAQLALGLNPGPRTDESEYDYSGLAAGLGTAVGSIGGPIVAAGAGTAAGEAAKRVQKERAA